MNGVQLSLFAICVDTCVTLRGAHCWWAHRHLHNAIESTEIVWRTFCNSACICEEDLILITCIKLIVYTDVTTQAFICTLFFTLEFDRNFTALFCFLNLQNLHVVLDSIVTLCLILGQVKERDGKTCTLY